jgi:hypothetical protein
MQQANSEAETLLARADTSMHSSFKTAGLRPTIGYTLAICESYNDEMVFHWGWVMCADVYVWGWLRRTIVCC